jgi:hypothetical protein
MLALALRAAPVEPILVSEQTFKINGEQLFYYAFEKGDQLWFDLDVLKGQSLKEVEISIYQGAIRWRVEQSASQLQKRLTVEKRAIYCIRIRSGGSKKVALKIRRLPYFEGRVRFDPYVQWKTVVDTLRPRYRVSQTTIYDTTYQTHYRRVLYKNSQQLTTLLSRTERVAAHTSLQHDNQTRLHIRLPDLTHNQDLEERLLGWSYWIGVGQEGLENYNQELRKFLLSAAAKVGSKNLLAGLALGAYAIAVNPPQGDNILYRLYSQRGAHKQLEAEGNVTAAFGRSSGGAYRDLYLELENDNILNALNVHLKMVVITEQRHYKQIGYQKRVITPLVTSEVKGKIRLVERKVPIINNW